MDANNIVIDREEWTNRVRTDFANNFSTNEHELFCDAFCLFPKRFGAISRHMGGLRTPSECVVHYYVTKKAVNYKQLLAQHKKKASKKAGRRAKPIRSRNVSQPQTPVSTPSVDTSSMEVGGYTDFKPEVLVPLFPPEPFAEEFFTIQAAENVQQLQYLKENLQRRLNLLWVRTILLINLRSH